MKIEIQKVLNLKNFFRISQSQSNSNCFTSYLKKPSVLLINNIYVSWLQSVHSKIHKNMPVFISNKYVKEKQELPFGFIVNDMINYDENTIIMHDVEDVPKKSKIELNLFVLQRDYMQYLTQWQRYRKFWWSSITTTPSLFSIHEIKHENERSETNIIAQFPWGQLTVETISTNSVLNQSASQLSCSLSLESAMFILLLDGLNNTREDYLRLHRNMAPFKISFALHTEDKTKKNDLCGLAKLLYYRLKSKGISTCVPEFTYPLEKQIRENLQLGVTYTAILYENTLTSGILHLLNSSTMLKEETHVADFESYAALLCSK